MRGALIVFAVLFASCGKRDYVVQPKLDFEVHSDAGVVTGAKVWLLTSSDPHHQREALVSVTTGDDGRARFDEKHESIWVFPLMIHGVPFYSWQWCVEAPGYAAQVDDRRANPSGSVSVRLETASEAQTCVESGGDLEIVK